MSTWTINFTEQFSRDVKALDKGGYTQWLKQLSFLKQGPNQSHSALKTLRNHSKTYRWRKGDVRVIFRVIGSSKAILLQSAGLRKHVYSKMKLSSTSVGEFAQLLEAENNKPEVVEQEAKVLPVQQALFELPDDNDVEDAFIEEIFVDLADLHILSIPDEYYSIILDSTSVKELETTAIPKSLISRIEDYLTSPVEHQVGKVYSLSVGDEMSSINSQPLESFLLALDPQQKKLVERNLDSGPLLIRGGPGTGKTLINLARMKRIVDEHSQQDLITSMPLRIGFVTFNKSLSQSAQSLYLAISENNRNVQVEFKTLDSIVYQLGSQMSTTSPSISTDDTSLIFKALNKARDSKSDEYSYLQQIVSKRGSSFILEEFEQVILGNDLLALEDYLAFQRKGRKVPLQTKERTGIHTIFTLWIQVYKQENKVTFSMRRLKVQRALSRNQLTVRPYDYLFVDELQDLSPVSIRLLTHLVKYPERLTFTADTAQSIYQKSPTWSSISEKLKFHSGNSHILRSSYRMTKQISDAVLPLRLNAGDAAKEDDGIENAVYSGPVPLWIETDRHAQEHRVTKTIISLVKEQSINPSQIAVIVPDKRHMPPLSYALNAAGVTVNHVSRDTKLNLLESSVNILTAYAAKGLEFPFVLVTSVSSDRYPQLVAMNKCQDEQQKIEELERSKRLLYVALSRASRGLWMFVDRDNPSQLLQELNPKHWEKAD
ncbi:3'-5' exonuclease [Vibrio breoganii]|uniref:3'-5' exonuclease n=1 Tax=Vibrio breoganii TaxID=553239 RepID=UPI0021C48EFF|nr:3'-5' exonuclease [Vibrio breoganii]MDN3716539.1 3'-5' exonuclease [Vibrio breoganii]